MNPHVEVVVVATLAKNYEVEIMVFLCMEVVVFVDNTCLDDSSTLDCLRTNHKFFDYTQNNLP